MKKLKRNHSVGHDKMQPKIFQNRPKNKPTKPKPTKPKPRQKKANIELLDQENTNILMGEKEKLFKPDLKKNIGTKKAKERSKSILSGKKSTRKFDESANKKQNATFYQFCRTNQIKEQVDTIDPIDSFRCQERASKESFSHMYRQNFGLCKQREISTQFKKVLYFDQELQCSSFSLYQCRDQKKRQNETQKKEYVQKIQALQKEILQNQLQNQKRLSQLQQCHQIEDKLLKQQIQTLQKRNMQLCDQKRNLEITVEAQKAQIATQHQIHQLLEEKLRSEEKIKHQLIKANDQSQDRIKSLEAELCKFEQNLNDFQKMKDAYEIRLETLEADKQRIKGNALELLQILQKIKSNQHN